MKKRIGMLVLAAMLVWVVGACSNGNKNEGNKKTETNDEIVELTFWRHDYEVEAQSFRNMITTFEKEHPNIKVKLELFPNDQYETKIRTALAGNSAPDIIAIDGPTLASYAHNGALIPLDDYMSKDGNIDDISKPVIESLTYNGSIYAVPNNDASLAMFYNKKMFEAKGIPLPSKNANEAWTWEQVLDAAKKLNDPANGVYGWNPNPWGFAGHEGVTFMDMTFLWQAGSEILSPDASTAKGYLDSDEAKRALTFFQSLYNSEGVAPKELPQDAFPNGNVAIHVDGPWAFSTFSENYPNFVLGEDYDVAPLWKDAKQVSPNGSWNVGITTQSKHPDEAWLFVNWVTGIEGSKTWYEDTKNLPARQSTTEAFAELKEYPMNIFVEQSANYAKPRPATAAYPAISEAIRLLFEEVGLGNADVSEALDRAVKKIEDGIAQID